MTTTVDKSYIGKGEIFGKRNGVNEAKRSFGNCHSLSISTSLQERSLADFRSTSGGSANSSSRIDTVTGSIDMRDVTAQNLAASGWGTVTAVTAGAVTDEAHTGYVGGLIRTAYNIDSAQTVTVTGTGGTPTYVAGTDYEVRPAGILVLSGGSISDSTALEISYTKLAGNRVEFMVASGVEYELTFDGLNEAQSGEPMVVDIWRFKPAPFQTFDLLGDDYATLTIAGEFLKDSTKGAGESGFFRADSVA